jgi:hypothetical protein
VSLDVLRRRVQRLGWRGVREPARFRTRAANRALIRRLYKAIDTKLHQMELRMANEIARGGDASTAGDHERDTRAIGGLITQLGKISEFAADLNRPTGQDNASATVAEEADRYRRKLAERLARLVGPSQ